MMIFFTFTLLMLPAAVTYMSITGYSGGGVIIKCKYDQTYQTNQKYFCSDHWVKCFDLIKTKDKDKWFQTGRYFLYDNTSASVFTVIIRNLSQKDSGTYKCGTDIFTYRDSYTKLKLNVRKGRQSRTVTGYSGGSIIINSQYEATNKNDMKYFCKSETHDPCFELMYANKVGEWKHKDRFSIHDDRSAGLLRVFIRELTLKDSGKYQIVFKVSANYSFFTELNLYVIEDGSCQKSISLTGTAGGAVNISCKYPQSHRTDGKFLCWRTGPVICTYLTSVKDNRRWIKERQLSLYDDREQQVLTVIFSNLTKLNSAEYWCGIESDQGYKALITRVILNVTEKNIKIASSPSPSLSSSPPSSSSSQVHFVLSSVPSSLSSSSFYFPSIKTPVTDISTSNITTGLHVTSSGSVIITALVVLVLILIGLFLTVTLYKRNKSQSSMSKRSHTGQRKYDEGSQTSVNYEEIKDTRHQDNSNTGKTSEYSTVQLPTNPSDSVNTVYATAQLPIYATAEKPIRSSESSASAEGQNYALVNFHKTPDCSDHQLSFNKQDQCDYAAVNHGTV